MQQESAIRGGRFFRVYIMPAAVLQSVIVGGGYGTGREVTEFVSSAGPLGGFAAVGLVFGIWAVLIALSFELARIMGSYDYRHFLKGLVGRAWVIYEVLAIIALLLVLAVVLSASSELILDALGVPRVAALGAVIAAIAWVMHSGRAWVERLLSAWAGLVSLFLLAVFVLVALASGPSGFAGSWDEPLGSAWIAKGATFAFYNIALVPVLLYTLTEIRTRREAFTSGVIAAAAGILPALVMHLTFLPSYPLVLDQPLPMYAVISGLDIPVLKGAYFIVLFGTILLTAVGALQGVAERVDGWLGDARQAAFGARGRLVLATTTLIASAALSGFGVIDLVASGYGTIAWGFLAIYIIPVLTVGLARIIRTRD